MEKIVELQNLFFFFISRFQLKDLHQQNQFTGLHENLYQTLVLVAHLMKVMLKHMEQYQRVHYKLYTQEYGSWRFYKLL